MPADGLDWLPGEQLLRPDELARLMHIAVTRLGITSVRFTGGEPLLSRHLEEVVAATASLAPRPEISLTTNRVGLARRACPLDAGHQWRRDATLTADDVLAALRPHFRLRPDTAPRGSAPAELWLVDTGPNTPSGKFGVIASVSHAFCSTCDRTRLTADGQIRSCLFSAEETDLRGLLRGGADDDAIEAAWRAAGWAKPAGHGINDPDFIQPDRPMSAIGG